MVLSASVYTWRKTWKRLISMRRLIRAYVICQAWPIFIAVSSAWTVTSILERSCFICLLCAPHVGHSWSLAALEEKRQHEYMTRKLASRCLSTTKDVSSWPFQTVCRQFITILYVPKWA